MRSDLVHSVMVDENYMLVAAHLEESLQGGIIKGEYVDFSRLIPRDRILEEEDETMQMIVKNGQTFWRPAKNFGMDTQTISSLHRWEQAFQVFSDVYLRAHPGRAAELIQYNHIIHTTAATYVWENVYSYDKDFRLHISKFPSQSLGIILQQAWNFRLKEKVRFERNQGKTYKVLQWEVIIQMCANNSIDQEDVHMVRNASLNIDVCSVENSDIRSSTVGS